MMNCSLQYNKDNKNIILSSDTACIWSCVVKSGNITLNPYWGELSANSKTNVTIWTYGTEELFGNVICRFDDGNCQVIKEETVRSSNLGVFFITNRDLYLFGEGTKSRFYVYYGKRQTKWNDILSSVEFIYGENNQSILSYSGNSISGTVDVEGYELYNISCSKYNEDNGYFEVTITSLSGVAFNDSFIIKAKSFEGEGNSVGDLYQHYTINVYQEVIENRPTVFKITPNVIHLSSMFPKQRVSVISLYEGKNQPYHKVTDTVNQIINITEQYLLGQNITNKNEVMVLNEPSDPNHTDLVTVTKKSSYIEVDISEQINHHNTENGTIPHQLYFAMENNTSYSGMLTYYYTHIQIPNNELYFKNINNVYAYVDENGTKSSGTSFNTFSAKTISIYFTKNEEIVPPINNCYYIKYDVNKLVNFEIYSNPSKWIIERQSIYTDEVQRDKFLSLQLTDNIPSNSYETIQLFNNKAAYASIRVYSDEIFVKDKYAFNFGVEESKDKIENITLDNNTNSAFTINILSQNSEFQEISWLEETKTIEDEGIEGYLNVKALYYKIKNDTNSSSTPIKIDENQNIKKMDSVIYEPQIIDYQFKIKYKVDINKYYITYGILHDKKIGNNVEKELKDTNEYFFEHKDNLYEIEIPQPYIGHDIGWYVSHRGNGIKFNVKRYSTAGWEEISEGEIASKGGYNVNGNSGETQIHIINQVFSDNDLSQLGNFQEGDVLLFPKTMIENTITETIELQQEKTLQVLTIYVTLSGNSTTESNEVFRIGQLGAELTAVTSTSASNRTTCPIDTYDDAITLVYESYKKNNSFSKTEKDVILNITKRFEIKPYFENVSELNNIANQNNAKLKTAVFPNTWKIKDGYLVINNQNIFLDDNCLKSNNEYSFNIDENETFYEEYIIQLTVSAHWNTSVTTIYFNNNNVSQNIFFSLVNTNDENKYTLHFNGQQNPSCELSSATEGKINKSLLRGNIIELVVVGEDVTIGKPLQIKITFNVNQFQITPKNSIFFNKKYIFETETDSSGNEISGTVKDFDITYQILEKVVTLNGNHYILDGENNVSYNNKIYKAFEDNDKLKLSFDTVLYDLQYNNQQWCFDNDKKKLDNNLSYNSNGEVFYPNFKAKIPSGSTIEILESVDGNLEKLGFMDVDDYIILSHKKYNLNVNGDMVCLDDNKTLEVTSAKTANIENGLEINPSLNRAYDYVIINDEKYQLIDNKLIYENEVYYPQTYKINSTTTLQNMFVINRKGYSAMTQEAENYVLINHNKCPIDGNNFYFYQISGNSKYEYYQVENVIKETFKYSIDLNNLLGEDIIVGKYNENLLLVDGYIKINNRDYYPVEKKHSINTNVYPYKVETKYFVKINNNEYDVLKNVIKINNVIYNVTQVNNQDAVIINYNTYFVQNGQILYSGQTYDVHERCINSGNTLIDVIKFIYQDVSNNDNMEKDNNVVYGYISNNTISAVTYNEVLSGTNISYEIYLPTYYIESKNNEGNLIVSGYTLSNITNINNATISYNKANINYFGYKCVENGGIELVPKNIIIENGKFTIDIDEYRVVKSHSLMDNINNAVVLDDIKVINVSGETLILEDEIDNTDDIYDVGNEYWYTNKDNKYLVYPSDEDKYEVSVWDWYANKMLPMVKIYDSVEIKNGTVIGNITLTNIEYEVEENNYVKIRDEIQDLSNAISSSSVTINQVFQIPYDGDGYIKICLDEINDNEFVCLPLTFIQEQPILTYGAFTFSNTKIATLPEQLLQSIRRGDYIKCKILGRSSSQKNINIIIFKHPFENIDNNNNTVTIQEDIDCIIHTDANNSKYIDLNLDMYAAPTFLLKYLPSYQTYGNGKVFSLQKINDTDYEVFNVDIENKNVENVKYGRYTVDFNQEDLDVKQYFTITALENTKITLSNPNFQTLEICLNGAEEWDTIISNGSIQDNNNTIVLPMGVGDEIQFRGVNNNITSIGTFTSDATIHIGGNIMSLLHYSNFDKETTLPPNVTLEGLFKGCTKLIDAKNLLIPIKEVPNNGLKEMFSGCTSLKYGPTMHLQTINENGCNRMFSRCSALENISNTFDTIQLSGSECCQYMFFECNKLVETPFTTINLLGNNNKCCQGMFAYCRSLTTTPNLPTTTLAPYCYESMFSQCKSLTEAPQLSATTLADWCYAYMFDACTSLNSVPQLKMETIGDASCLCMFNNCYKLKEITHSEPITEIGVSGCRAMFANCTNLTSCVKLINPTIDNSSCQDMYSGCTSLKSIPENFSFKNQLAYACYRRMFAGCTSLSSCPSTITFTGDTVGESCVAMFSGCKELSSSITLTLSGNSVEQSTYNSMFAGCTKLNFTNITIDYQQAKNNYSFASMFRGCSKIGQNITKFDVKLPSSFDESSSGTCLSMFEGCTSLNHKVTLRASTLAKKCYENMFKGCTSLTQAPDYSKLTKIGASGCTSMFENCTSLYNVYPITCNEISIDGCKNMFKGCKNLYQAPKLEITLKANINSSGALSHMFEGCVNLERTSPITILGENTTIDGLFLCMFSGSTNLQFLDEIQISEKLSMPSETSLIYMAWLKDIAPNGYYVGNFWGKHLSGKSWKQIDKNSSLSIPLCIICEKGGEILLENSENIYYKKTLSDPLIQNQQDWIVLNAKETLYIYSTCTVTICVLTNDFWCLSGNSMSTQFKNIDNRNYCNVTTLQNTPFIIDGNEDLLKTAPELPATTLTDSCYNGMFYGCTSLTTAPQLPATTLAKQCYSDMFYGCESLTEAPKLLATTLVEGCYKYMFGGCINLTEAPELPATELAMECYGYMFVDCINLTEAPELPATELEEGCYQHMFRGCTRLTTAPELSATTLTRDCYWNMFNDCTSLNNITMLATDIRATDCLTNWVYNVAKKGTFIKHPLMSLLPTATSSNYYRGIPEGWIVQNKWSYDYSNEYFTIEALEDGLNVKLSQNASQYRIDGGDNWTSLNANTTTQSINKGQKISFKITNPTISSSYGIGTFTINKKCNVSGNIMSLLYGDNFKGQSNLSGKSYAFKNLFQNCATLQNAQNLVLPATTIADYCYYYMFNNCTSLETAPELPATTLAKWCYAYMFYYCEKLTKVPQLSAATLSDYCYHYMFAHCTSLTEAPVLSANKLAEYCYSCMFWDCERLTTAPELPVKELEPHCYESMFAYCTSLTKAPDLPATNLEICCYTYMFRSCTSLKTTPNLNIKSYKTSSCKHMFFNCSYLQNAQYFGIGSVGAINDQRTGVFESCFENCTNLTTAPILSSMTTIGESVCYRMFKGCTKLKTAPTILAQSLDKNCCVEMFMNCSSLKEIKITTKTIYGENCFQNWVNGVGEGGIFVKSRELELQWGNDGIPYGWDVDYIDGPNVDENDYFTTYGNSGYKFVINTNQTNYQLETSRDKITWSYYELGDINSGYLAGGGPIYWRMKKGSTLKKDTPIGRFTQIDYTQARQTLISVSGNIMTLIYGDISDANSAIKIENDYQFQYLFSGCTHLKTAHLLYLPCNELSNKCYEGMFQECLTLQRAPELPATTLAKRCYNYMFYGCVQLSGSTTSIIKLPAKNVYDDSYSNMFFRCPKVKEIELHALSATTSHNGTLTTLELGRFYGDTRDDTIESYLGQWSLMTYKPQQNEQNDYILYMKVNYGRLVQRIDKSTSFTNWTKKNIT